MNAEMGRKGLRALGWTIGLFVLSYLLLKHNVRWWWVPNLLLGGTGIAAIYYLSEWYKSLD
jgi:hypothetical protein